MTVSDFMNLPQAAREKYLSHRKCPECGDPLVRTNHSAGDLHVQCIRCKNCPDCEDGE